MRQLRLSYDDGRPANHSACDKPTTMAERELLAFICAATRLFGSDQARFLKELWLDELAMMDSPPRPISCDWCLVTIAASAQLASRLVDLCRTESWPGTLETFAHQADHGLSYVARRQNLEEGWRAIGWCPVPSPAGLRDCRTSCPFVGSASQSKLRCATTAASLPVVCLSFRP
jgi:hypothetical protein